MGAVSAASGHSPVQLVFATLSKPPEDGNSFGSDFHRLASVATSPLGSAAKSWQTYPMRARSPEDNNGIPMGKWCAERASESVQAGRLKADPLAPRFVGEALERWRTSFNEALKADETFERDRATDMQRVRHGITPCAGPLVRAFDVEPFRTQLGEIAVLSDEVSAMRADVQSLAEGVPKKMLLKNLKDLTVLRDAMGTLTMGALGRQTNALQVELNTLIALNDMAREAEREMSNNGADVALRLAVRDGKWVLKPAKSTSWFASNKLRAANDCARLALLLGYPADQPVTLRMIRERGLGLHEYTSVLNDARSAHREAAGSWLAGRAFAIDLWKKEGSTVRDSVTPAAERREHGGTPVAVQRVSAIDDEVSIDGAEPETPGHNRLPLSAQTFPKIPYVLIPDQPVPDVAPAGSGMRPTGAFVEDAGGASRIDRVPAQSGDLYTRVAKSNHVQGPTLERPQEPFMEAFLGAHRVRPERVDLAAPSRAALGVSSHGDGRARALPPPPPPLPSSPPPLSLAPIRESRSESN